MKTLPNLQPLIPGVRKFLRWAIPVGALISILAILWSQGARLNWELIFSRWTLLFPILGCGTFTVGAGFLAWYRLLNRDKALLSLPASYRLFGAGSLSRYLPGGQVWQYISLLQFSKTTEVRTNAVAAQLFSTMGGLLAGALLLAVTWSRGPLRGRLDETSAAITIVLSLALLGMAWVSRARVRAFLERRFPLSRDYTGVSPGKFAEAVALSLGAWISVCVMVMCFLKMNDPAVWATDLPYLIACYSAATLGAYFTFITPSGLGVREAVLLLLLSQRYGQVEAAFATLGGSFSLFLAELLFFSPLVAAALRKPKPGIEDRVNDYGKAGNG